MWIFQYRFMGYLMLIYTIIEVSNHLEHRIDQMVIIINGD